VSEILVEINCISKNFPPLFSAALQEITAVIPKGHIVGIVGPDGAGKTTLIRLIAGLLTPTRGQITVAGFNTIDQAEVVHGLIGYMPQKFGLYQDLSVIQNLNFFADLRGLPFEEKKETFEKLLRFTGLANFVDRSAGTLSGGMKQKLGLACALIKKPQLLLLDEPSVGVDPISRRHLWQMVQELIGEGISVVWSTAYLEEAEKCDTVLLLNEGKLLFNGNPKELTKKVAGRVFKISTEDKDKRALLLNVLQHPGVLDATIQGSDLRFVSKDTYPLFPELHPQEEKPKFEDAFIDILGGGPGGLSALGEKTPFIPESTEDIIVADQLTKIFGGFTAVNDISITVKKGEVFGFVGPNGAGKSTAFKLLCGLLKPTSGKALVNGLDFQISSSKARSKIGYMAQKFSLYGNLSVWQNLNFFAGIYNLSGREKQESIQEMIDIFALDEYKNTSVDMLPLGFKQRLGLACSTMHHPSVLFLDEPTSGVDPITRREFWNHINSLVKKGVTVLISTHFMDEAEYCDRIALIYRGKMIDLATPHELKNKVKSPENLNPTFEDAFIQRIEEFDATHPQ
jgi:ABC-2 type transport system ATP-binding protein